MVFIFLFLYCLYRKLSVYSSVRNQQLSNEKSAHTFPRNDWRQRKHNIMITMIIAIMSAATRVCPLNYWARCLNKTRVGNKIDFGFRTCELSETKKVISPQNETKNTKLYVRTWRYIRTPHDELLFIFSC